MTYNITYQEQVISEFTLILLEELGWYEVNYYTGGLMRFGKNKGCDFLNKDCINIEESKAIPLFNDFCSSNSFATCSPGRQSRGYCLNNVHQQTLRDSGYEIYIRENLVTGYGKNNVDFCPISVESTDKNNDYYYTGNCKIGNNNYGGLLATGKSYGEDSTIFGEQFGKNSFCALSSLILYKEESQLDDEYKDIIRPTCYLMECRKRSLTIVLYNEYEEEKYDYIVCPRKGGLIQINIEKKNYSKFSGYFFCPDYNLICTTGNETCNNIFDCIKMKSLNKSGIYDYNYSPNNVPNEITLINYKNDNIDKNIIVEGYEEGDDGICPQNCIFRTSRWLLRHV